MASFSIKTWEEITVDVTSSGTVPWDGLYLGTAGDVTLTDQFGNTSTLPAMAAGVWHPIEFVGVASANTTATGIWGGRT